MANLFFIPQYVISGENAMKTSMDHLVTFGEKALVVTDNAMVSLGNVKKLTDALEAAEIKFLVYDEINTEPTHTMIDKGVGLYTTEGCDFLIALGGGSPIDAMKAIGAVVANGGVICDYMGKRSKNVCRICVRFPRRRAPVPKRRRSRSLPTRTPMSRCCSATRS